MIKVLQLFSCIIVFGVLPILAADFYSQSGFISSFMGGKSLALMGTMLAIYMAAASSFMALMNSYEQKIGKPVFYSTTKELQTNIGAVFVVFFLHLLLAAGTPNTMSTEILLIINGSKTFTFLLFLYALYELSQGIFTLRATLSKAQKTKD